MKLSAPAALAAVALAIVPLAPQPARADDDDGERVVPADDGYDFGWDRESDAAAAARVDYEREMDIGDDYASRVAWGGLDSATSRHLAQRAVLAYSNAASARPDDAEPHWRAALLLELMLAGYTRLPEYRRELIRHYDAFARLAPLDPRVDEMLFQRAIQHTHLATSDDLEAALLDYRALIDRHDLTAMAAVANTWVGNLGETYMMLGRMKEAIASYHLALELEASGSHTFGLAVALDRSEEGARSRQLLGTLGDAGIHAFLDSTMGPRPTIFFVPRGEELYYYGMAAEALGYPALARTCYQGFIRSAAHPLFDARAQAHVDRLASKKNVRDPDEGMPRCEP